MCVRKRGADQKLVADLSLDKEALQSVIRAPEARRRAISSASTTTRRLPSRLPLALALRNPSRRPTVTHRVGNNLGAKPVIELQNLRF